MITSPPLLLLLLLFLSLLDQHVRAKEEDTTLELVQMLYRHGDRSPITLYPSDPHNDTSVIWPMGLGQLTKKGKAMHYELGRWLRRRYKTLVGLEWVPDEVVIRSTDTDRTLMSAACNLAAFYYPEHEDERFEANLPWVPTPIHTVPVALDKLMSVDESCPRVLKEEEKLKDLPEVKKIIEDNQDLFKFLTEKAGEKMNSFTNVSYLYDTLSIESAYNLTLPSWTKGVWGRMEALSNTSFDMIAYTQELKRLRAGPLIKELGDNMKKKVAGQVSNTKMFMFSGHDTTIVALMEGLGVYNGIQPPYAATFLLELHRVKNQHFVKMYYRNDTAMQEAPHPLILPGCSERCLLEDWLSLTASVVSQDWSKECQSALSFDLPTSTFTAICVAVMFAVLFFVLLAHNIVTWHRQKSHFAYQAVPSSSP